MSTHERIASRRSLAALTAVLVLAALMPSGASAFHHGKGSFIGSFSKVATVGSTVPSNGDQNPYGIVTVPRSSGALVAGDILISNFNNAGTAPTGNQQGRGSTIVELSPSGQLTQFAEIKTSELPGECPGGVGLTTALTILPKGFVVVGSLPTTNGQSKTMQAGCLIVLDSNGKPVETISGPPINGPWDMSSVSMGQNSTLFVTNVLNGTVAAEPETVEKGTVVRIRLHGTDHRAPQVTDIDVIAEGFPERTDESALVVGPTGVALGNNGTLYVADTVANRIAAVPDALRRHTAVGGGGTTVTEGGFLMGPLGMMLAPNGDLVTANGADGNLVETTPAGAQFPPVNTGAGGGGLFGLTVAPDRKGVYFVNDTENTLDLLH
jgi:sugar lactone lactonase YvrE